MLCFTRLRWRTTYQVLASLYQAGDPRNKILQVRWTVLRAPCFAIDSFVSSLVLRKSLGAIVVALATIISALCSGHQVSFIMTVGGSRSSSFCRMWCDALCAGRSFASLLRYCVSHNVASFITLLHFLLRLVDWGGRRHACINILFVWLIF